MAKYHINAKGEPGLCKAQHECPFGGEQDHYGSKEEAARAYESVMGNGFTQPQRSASELNELAKTSKDREVWDDVIARGSARSFSNLAKNPSLDEATVAKAYKAAPAGRAKEALGKHKALPVETMEVSTWLARIEANPSAPESLTSSPAVGDAHVEALENSPKAKHLLNSVLRNSNSLSQAKLVQLAEKDWQSLGAALRSGQYPIERLPTRSPKLMYWGHTFAEKDERVLEAYSEWASRNPEIAQEKAIARTIAQNENANASALHRLATAGLAVDDVYKNPRTDASTKAYLVEKYPSAAQRAKIEGLEQEWGQDARTFLQDATSAQPQNTSSPRGFHSKRVKFDPHKVKAYGLSKNDIHVIMGEGAFNAGWSYDEATGEFRGDTDSSG